MVRLVALLLIPALSGCGAGPDADSRYRTTSTITKPHKTSAYQVIEAPALPKIDSGKVGNLPITYGGFDGRRLYVGRRAAPDYPLIPFRDREYVIFYGSRHEYLDGKQMSNYLDEIKRHGSLLRYSAPPTVHVGQDLGQYHNVLLAVQWINDVLPPSWHLTVGERVPALSSSVPPGAIYVDFASADQLGDRLPFGAAGVSKPYRYNHEEIQSSNIYIDPERVGWYDPQDDVFMQKVIIHELLHSLGLLDHVSRQDSRLFDVTLGHDDSTTMLFPIDRQVLFALYSRLSIPVANTYHQSFGQWSTLGDHLIRKQEFSEFGVVRQGDYPGQTPMYVQGWAAGDTPQSDLKYSGLTGQVVWSGNVIGVTPDSPPSYNGYRFDQVFGLAELSVDLRNLTGRAKFTELIAGGVRTWRDGDLEYTVEVLGNTFYQTEGSPDLGTLTGIFAGSQHEEATGVLERVDLTAAFGVSRE